MAAQPPDRVTQRLGGIGLATVQDILETGLDPRFQVKQHGEPARAAHLPATVVPEKKPVRGGGQDLAPHLGLARRFPAPQGQLSRLEPEIDGKRPRHGDAEQECQGMKNNILHTRILSKGP